MLEVVKQFFDLKEGINREVGEKFSCDADRKKQLLETGKVKLVETEKKQVKPPTAKKKK
ncbi:MAG TPA: hypothetical protein VMW91_10770 [Desulfosporosinus sp.]|nr:hypothetical protein [Desulfosporosinus sp.]